MKGYTFPVYATESCPKNETKWIERSIALNCNETNGYMCILNEQLTVLSEFCYTKPKISIPKGKRAMVFINVIIRLQCRSLYGKVKKKDNFT